MKPIHHDLELLTARNIGSGIAARLANIGINTMADLIEVGPASAYRRMSIESSGEHLPACFYLYSLKGAIEDRDWRSLNTEEKADLRMAAGL